MTTEEMENEIKSLRDERKRLIEGVSIFNRVLRSTTERINRLEADNKALRERILVFHKEALSVGEFEDGCG